MCKGNENFEKNAGMKTWHFLFLISLATECALTQSTPDNVVFTRRQFGMTYLDLLGYHKRSTMAKTMKSIQAGSVDEYIASFPKDVQKQLEALRTTVQKAAPGVEEAIKYGIPTFVLNGNLVSFGAWKDHIGFYPAPREVEGFKKALSAYEGAKSTARFPLDKPLPLSLISKIVKFNAKRNQEKANTKLKKKKS